MNHCKDCKWWANVTTSPEAGWRGAHRGWGSCERATDTDGALMEAWESDQGYWGDLYTAPDFGCVMWEAKALDK